MRNLVVITAIFALLALVTYWGVRVQKRNMHLFGDMPTISRMPAVPGESNSPRVSVIDGNVATAPVHPVSPDLSEVSDKPHVSAVSAIAGKMPVDGHPFGLPALPVKPHLTALPGKSKLDGYRLFYTDQPGVWGFRPVGPGSRDESFWDVLYVTRNESGSIRFHDFRSRLGLSVDFVDLALIRDNMYQFAPEDLEWAEEDVPPMMSEFAGLEYVPAIWGPKPDPWSKYLD